MAERIAGLAIDLDLNTSGLSRSLSDVKRSFRGLESSMKTTSNNMRFGEKTVDNYRDGVHKLNDDIVKQEKNLNDLGKQYDEAAHYQGTNSKEAINLATQYNKQADKINMMKNNLETYTGELHQMEIKSSAWFRVGDMLQGFSGRLTDVSNTAQVVGSALTNYITKPAGIAAFAVGGLVSAFGWGRLVSLDEAQAKLKGLGYSTEEVGSISDTVTDAIDGGMTTMAEGVDIAAGALAAGVDEGKDLEKYIQLVGDAAVGANRPVEDMAQIFNRVQGQGKLMTQELNMIEQSMPGFSNAMAEHMGVGVEEFREMVTAGEVSSEDFLEVMDDFAGGMADAYAESWSGMVQNTKAYIGQIGEALLGGVFEQSKDSLREFEDLLSSEETMEAAERAGEKIGDTFEKIVSAVKSVVNWYRNLSDGQQNLILKLGGLAIALGPLIKGFGLFLKPIISVTGWIGKLFKWIAPILTPLTKVGGAASSAGGSVGILSRALSVLGGPVGWIIGIVSTLATGFTVAYKKSDTFREFVHSLGEKLKEVGQGIWEWMKPGIDAVIKFFGDMRDKIASFKNEEGPQLMEAFSNIWEFIKPILDWLAEKVKWVFETIIKPIMTGVMWAVEEVIKSVWGTIKSVISGTLDIVMGAVKTFSGIFTGDWEQMWEGIKQIVKGAIGIVWGAIKNSFIGRIIGAVIEFVSNFKSKISDLWEYVKLRFKVFIMQITRHLAQSFTGKIILTIIDFVKNFKTRISNMWTRAKEIFTNAISTIWTKIKESFVGRIISKIASFSSNFKDKISNLWEYIKRRFKVMIIQIVRNLQRSFIGKTIKKIGEFVSNFKERISNMWTSIKNKFTNMIKTVYGKIKNSFVGRILKSGRTLKSKFTGIISDMWTKTKDKFTDMVDGAKKLPGRIGKGISGAKQGAIDGMKKMGNGLLKWAAKPFNKVGSGVNWVTEKLGIGKVIKGKWSPKKYAKGTGGHPGGPAVLGDGKGSNSGSELVSTPGGGSFLSASSPTLYPNLPKGTEVLPAKQTKQVPMYGKGIFGSTKDFVGRMWGGAKKAGTWLSEKVGDVWDWVKKPFKLANKVLNGIGYPSKDEVGKYPHELIKGGFKTIRKKAGEAVKGWFTEAEEGGGGGKPNFDYPITSKFGPRPSPGGIGSSNHMGVDFGFPYGTKVPSQTDGTVSGAKKRGGYGNTVSVKSGVLEILYAHLSKMMKKTGDHINKGDILGKSGMSGTATGPHLHYEVRKNGTPVDPMKLSSGGGKGAPGGKGVERWRPQVKQALKANNLSTSKAMQDKVLRQIKTESGGNEKAVQSPSVNDINMRMGTPAQGLMQTIPSTFHANKHAGHGNIKNGYDNLLAALAYAKKRYGPSLGHLGSGIGYKQGTNYVPQDGPAMLHRGEAVIPKEFNQPAKKTSATKLLALVGKSLQKEKKTEESNEGLLEATRQQNALLSQQNAQQAQMVNLLTQLLQKDDGVYLDGDQITGTVNQKNALAAIGKHF